MSDTKVLHIIARMNVGGTARYVGELVKGIPGSKLATGYVQGQEIEDPILKEISFIRVKHLGRKISPINDLKSWLELSKIINEHEPEIIHTHTFKAGIIGRLVPGKYKRIHTFHGHLFEDSSFSKISKILINLIEKLLAKRTDIFISVGERVGREIRERGIGKKKNWSSIAPGIKPLSLIDKGLARQTLGYSDSKLLVGWLARMATVKNPVMLLEIAKVLPEIEFVMGGGGNQLAKIQGFAPKNVKVLGWTDPNIFWSAVDVAVSTSLNEGVSISLIEAISASLPIISTDVGSNEEIVINNVNGFLVNPNPGELAEKLKLILNDSHLRNSMGIASQIQYEKLFKIEELLRKHQQIYEN